MSGPNILISPKQEKMSTGCDYCQITIKDWKNVSFCLNKQGHC